MTVGLPAWYRPARFMNEYEYDAGEPWSQRKHAPQGSEPFYKKQNGRVITTCPNTIDQTAARGLLNQPNRFEWRDPNDPREHPDAIWVMHDGVLYRAEPTRVGHSYHGFPETRNMLDKKLRGKKQLRSLLSWAEQHGQRATLEEWLERTKDWG